MLRLLLSPRLVFLLGALFCVLASKLALIDVMGSDVPLGEQWTVEGSTLFQIKLHRGYIPAEHFAFPSGEHRPLMTRAWAYLWFVADGEQWDCRVQAVANLVFHAATFLVLWFASASFASGRGLFLARLLTTALCALPANHENFTWGFQSQFLLCILCGLGHVIGTARAERPDWRWFGAQLTGFIGILSLASGLLSAVALVGLAAVEWLRGRRDTWLWATLLANGTLLAFGVWFAVKISANNAYAQAVGPFLRAFFTLLCWPVPGGWGVISQMPFLAALAWAWRQPAGPGPAARFLGLAAWFWLLLAALAYGRGGQEMRIAVRYFDMLVIGCWLNGIAAIWLWPRLREGVRDRWVLAALVLFLLPMLGGLAYWNRPAGVKSTVESMQLVRRLRDDVVRDFLATDDPAVFKRYDWLDSRFPHLPYTIELLRDPLMRPVLPPSLQADGRAGLLSRAALWLASIWPGLLAAGAALLLLGGWRSRVTG